MTAGAQEPQDGAARAVECEAPATALDIDRGSPLPLGAHVCCGGINFAVFSRHATRMSLLLFEAVEDAAPCAIIEFDPQRHRTGDIWWHVWVTGRGPGTLYAWRVDGPYRPEHGHRFNRYRLLLDPYAGALAGTRYWDFARAGGFDPGSPGQDLASATKEERHSRSRSASSPPLRALFLRS